MRKGPGKLGLSTAETSGPSANRVYRKGRRGIRGLKQREKFWGENGDCLFISCRAAHVRQEYLLKGGDSTKGPQARFRGEGHVVILVGQTGG